MTNPCTTCESCLKSLESSEWRVCADCLRKEFIKDNQEDLYYFKRFLNYTIKEDPNDTLLIEDLKQKITEVRDYINQLMVVQNG